MELVKTISNQWPCLYTDMMPKHKKKQEFHIQTLHWQENKCILLTSFSRGKVASISFPALL
jgi:hypothetical protein